jgi:hypothetical protein
LKPQLLVLPHHSYTLLPPLGAMRTMRHLNDALALHPFWSHVERGHPLGAMRTMRHLTDVPVLTTCTAVAGNQRRGPAGAAQGAAAPGPGPARLV